jgi:hypothetical protein
MFKIDHNGSLAGGTHINLPAGFNYTGNAVAITDSISGGTPPVALFGLSDLFCDGYDEAAPTGYCLYMNPPSGGYLQLLDIYNVRSTFMNGLYMGVSGTNAYINGVDFHGLALEDNSNPAHLLVMDSGTSTLGVSNNNFYGVQFEATSGPGITYIGSSPLENNNFYGNMFDMTTEILNSSSGVFKNNNFIGYIGLSNTVVVKQPFTVASAATATPVTVYTLPGSSVATYFVSCSVGVENAGSYYAATSLVTLDGTTANITSLAAGAGMAITLSGLNVQAAQASGGPLPIYCSLMQWK